MAKSIGAIYGSWTGIAFFGAASKFTNHASEKVLRGGYIFPQSGQSKQQFHTIILVSGWI